MAQLPSSNRSWTVDTTSNNVAVAATAGAPWRRWCRRQPRRQLQPQVQRHGLGERARVAGRDERLRGSATNKQQQLLPADKLAAWPLPDAQPVLLRRLGLAPWATARLLPLQNILLLCAAHRAPACTLSGRQQCRISAAVLSPSSSSYLLTLCRCSAEQGQAADSGHGDTPVVAAAAAAAPQAPVCFWDVAETK